MQDLVSVVIPSYNREKTILRAVNSVLTQTYDNIEVIVVDDCSTDNTVDVLKGVSDKRLKVIKLPKNSGACCARNVGIENSKGKYIAFQDSDDEWHKDKLEVQLAFMKKNNAKISFCNFNKMIERTNTKTEFPSDVREGIISYEELLARSISSTQCIIADKECLNDIRFDLSLPRLQDWDFTLELSKKFDVYHLNKALVDVYMQANSISKNPGKGVKALEILWSKNEDAIKSNKNIEYKWNIYMGNYILETRCNPSKYYKKALKLNFTMKIFFKYLLAKLHVLVPLYKLMKKI